MKTRTIQRHSRATRLERQTVSLIIPARNEGAVLHRLLNSVSRLKDSATLRLAEVIVVDASSTDDTAELAREAGCRVVHAPAGNVSISRNTGARAARGDILAFVDADCELPANWLTDVCGLVAEREVAAAGGVMAVPPCDAPWVERIWFDVGNRVAPEKAESPNTRASWLPSFNLAVKAFDFNRVGGFDESLKTCEDVDLSLRLAECGELRCLNVAPVRHHGESKTVAEFFRRESWRAGGTLQLLCEHRGNVREWISFLVSPSAIVVSTLAFTTGVIMLFQSLMDGQSFLPFAAAMLFVMAPYLVLSLLRRIPVQRLPSSCVLLWIYSIARCWGMVYNSSRVARRPLAVSD
ncbi:MAG: glycosyltransferase [Planctomycetaceae bacterium]|nr:glycosyltransferase [Planctomycetaceae bacterium]